MSMIEWPDWDCCFVISVRWIASPLPVFNEAFAKHAHILGILLMNSYEIKICSEATFI